MLERGQDGKKKQQLCLAFIEDEHALDNTAHAVFSPMLSLSLSASSYCTIFSLPFALLFSHCWKQKTISGAFSVFSIFPPFLLPHFSLVNGFGALKGRARVGTEWQEKTVKGGSTDLENFWLIFQLYGSNCELEIKGFFLLLSLSVFVWD